MSELFRLDDDDRFQRLRLIPWWDQSRLANSHVMVVGAGAIGNEVLKNLALVGVGTLHVIDMDDVETSNLTRSVLFRESDIGRSKVDAAADEVAKISPTTQVIRTKGNVLSDIGLGDFAKANIVLGCVDNREARLWINRSCWRVGRPWIDAGVQEIDGVIQAFGSRQAPCYECGLKDNDYRLLQARHSCLHLDEDELTLGRIPTTPTVSSIVGGWQSQMALKYLHQKPIAWGEALIINGWQDGTYRTKLPTKEDCLSHEAWQVDLRLGEAGRQMSVKQFLRATSLAFGLGKPATLLLEREFISQLKCPICQEQVEVLKNRWQVPKSVAFCQRCQVPRSPEIQSRVDQASTWFSHTLADLGIPMNDWVQVLCDDQLHVVSLCDEETDESSRSGGNQVGSDDKVEPNQRAGSES
jgi:molybdopterin-synthase adenylyltransferase